MAHWDGDYQANEWTNSLLGRLRSDVAGIRVPHKQFARIYTQFLCCAVNHNLANIRSNHNVRTLRIYIYIQLIWGGCGATRLYIILYIHASIAMASKNAPHKHTDNQLLIEQFFFSLLFSKLILRRIGKVCVWTIGFFVVEWTSEHGIHTAAERRTKRTFPISSQFACVLVECTVRFGIENE